MLDLVIITHNIHPVDARTALVYSLARKWAIAPLFVSRSNFAKNHTFGRSPRMARHRLAGDASMARVPLRASQHGRPSSGCQRPSVAAAPLPPKRDFVRKCQYTGTTSRSTIFDPGDEPKRTTHLMDVNYASTAWDVSVSCGD